MLVNKTHAKTATKHTKHTADAVPRTSTGAAQHAASCKSGKATTDTPKIHPQLLKCTRRAGVELGHLACVSKNACVPAAHTFKKTNKAVPVLRAPAQLKLIRCTRRARLR